MRCLFTMFAEDVRLLRERIFSNAFDRWLEAPEFFPSEVEDLWTKMDQGGTLWGGGRIWRFNGGLFAEPFGLPLDRQQLQTLKRAAESDWADVEPAIFGTLLERALDPKERHRLGAHYTPRAYVERLVRPTIEEPLRNEWETVRATVRVLLASPDADANRKTMAEARAEVARFLERLTQVRILDPACGTGNFLYVSLDVLKRLENEALEMYEQLGGAKLTHYGRLVSPQQFLGIEIKRWAKEIAELVLWIGYLQWQVRTKGFEHPEEPILRDYHNIECRDALLAYDEKVPLLDENGEPVTRWDGVTMKRHPVTGEDVPDDSAQVPVYRYINPHKAEWPEAEFIVGNPPFIGSKLMREVLGDEYVDAIQSAWSEVPHATDFVLRWWNHAAKLTRYGTTKRFGFIATKSISQAYNRRVLVNEMSADNPISITFAIPNHPWTDAGADVRVAMTVATAGVTDGVLWRVTEERSAALVASDNDLVVTLTPTRGHIHPDLSVGPKTFTTKPLRANERLCAVGMKTIGGGFVVDSEHAQRLLQQCGPSATAVIRPYLNGRDLASATRGVYVIDLFGFSEHDVRSQFPAIYQHLLVAVKEERERNRNKIFRDLWWVIGHPRPIFRQFTAAISRYIVTIETSRHRFFTFLPPDVVPDSTLVTFGLQDAFALGVLSSRIHVAWSLAAGGRLGVGNDPRYNKTVCFEPFPFPLVDDVAAISTVRRLAEALDAHRKSRLQRHKDLTVTDMYNVLEKLRKKEVLTEREKVIHETGLVSVMKQLHEELDAAVFDTYDWPHDLTDEQILERLVALNAERAEEEQRGIIRWLRPEFQNPAGATAVQQTVAELETDLPPAAADTATGLRPWPKELPAQIAAVREVVTTGPDESWSAERTSRTFRGAKRAQVETVLESLSALGLLVAFGEGSARQWKAAG
jgi:hypothetical protein